MAHPNYPDAPSELVTVNAARPWVNHPQDHEDERSEIDAVTTDLVAARGAEPTLADKIIALEAAIAGGGAPLSDDDPADLGTVDPGIAVEASRADHVHAMPDAADVGADPDGSAAAALIAAASYTDTEVGDEAIARADADTAHADIVDGTAHGISGLIAAAIAALVDSSPGTLDTLNELADALGDDPNFATTVTNLIAGKQDGDADLTAIAALTTTTFGRAFLTLADAPAGRAALALGTAATLDQGLGAANLLNRSDADGLYLQSPGGAGAILLDGDSYTVLGGGGTIVSAHGGFAKRLAAALRIPGDELRYLGRGGAQGSSPSDGSDGDATGAGVMARRLFPDHIYFADPTPVVTGRMFAALGVLKFGINDPVRLWTAASTVVVRAFKHGMRDRISRHRAAMLFQGIGTQWIALTGAGGSGGGSWSADTTAPHAATGGTYWKSAAANDEVRLTIPADLDTDRVAVLRFLGTSNLHTYMAAANDSATSLTLVDVWGTGAHNLINNGDVIEIGSTGEQILVGTRSGTSLTGCTRHVNGSPTASIPSNASIYLPTTTARVDVSVDGGASVAHYLAGQGASAASGAGQARTMIGVAVRVPITRANAGKVIVAKVAGCVGLESVRYDTAWLEDPTPAPMLVLNQPKFPYPSTASFFGEGSNADVFNSALGDVVAEFDSAVKIADVRTYIEARYRAVIAAGSSIPASGSASFTITPTDAGLNRIDRGSVIKVDSEELLVDSRSGNVVSVLAGGRGYNATTPAAHAAASGVTDCLWLGPDRIHPSELGHLLYTVVLLSTLASVPQTDTQRANSGMVVARKEQTYRTDYWYTCRHSSRSTQSINNDQEWAMPFRLGEWVTLLRVGIEITGGGASTRNLRFGLRPIVDGRPSLLYRDLGLLISDCSITGVRTNTADILTQIPPGLWVVTLAPQGTGAAPTLRSFSDQAEAQIGQSPADGPFSGSAVASVCWKQDSVAGALPSAWTTLSLPNKGPLISLKFGVPIRV